MTDHTPRDDLSSLWDEIADNQQTGRHDTDPGDEETLRELHARHSPARMRPEVRAALRKQVLAQAGAATAAGDQAAGRGQDTSRIPKVTPIAPRRRSVLSVLEVAAAILFIVVLGGAAFAIFTNIADDESLVTPTAELLAPNTPDFEDDATIPPSTPDVTPDATAEPTVDSTPEATAALTPDVTTPPSTPELTVPPATPPPTETVDRPAPTSVVSEETAPVDNGVTPDAVVTPPATAESTPDLAVASCATAGDIIVFAETYILAGEASRTPTPDPVRPNLGPGLEDARDNAPTAVPTTLPPTAPPVSNPGGVDDGGDDGGGGGAAPPPAAPQQPAPPPAAPPPSGDDDDDGGDDDGGGDDDDGGDDDGGDGWIDVERAWQQTDDETAVRTATTDFTRCLIRTANATDLQSVRDTVSGPVPDLSATADAATDPFTIESVELDDEETTAVVTVAITDDPRVLRLRLALVDGLWLVEEMSIAIETGNGIGISLMRASDPVPRSRARHSRGPARRSRCRRPRSGRSRPR